MMPAVKHLDPVLGVDIHFIITPPGPVVPIPHPHIGIVFDPFDYLPIIGATVVVNGLPRAQAGTGGRTLPPHFPMGGVFAKPPGNENETFMGSSTVVVEDEPFTYMLLPVLSCQDIGMPSPPRKKGPGAKTLQLPT
ncbi:MAG TPA: PAAR domain-containing protein, partial [Archangium sp.]|uniref:PAAR domain-containing protein n=1 Tax=Archangium sp. TaxID=1872627 RepID=UPI002E36D46D